jgi:hypothetical protein
MSKKNSSDVIDSLNGGTGNPTTLLRTSQVENIIAKLRDAIEERDKNFADAKSLILELARHLDETRQSEQSQICRKIKEMLADKINEGKITGKWIEECLPQEYKRKYAKSELSSLSGNAKKVGKILVDNEGKGLAEPSSYEISYIDNIAHIAHIAHTQTQGKDRNPTLQKDTPNNLGTSENDYRCRCISVQEWEGAFRKALMMTQDEDFFGAEIKFTIPKDRYEEVKTAMSNGSNCCYLIFDRNTGLLLRTESGN